MSSLGSINESGIIVDAVLNRALNLCVIGEFIVIGFTITSRDERWDSILVRETPQCPYMKLECVL